MNSHSQDVAAAATAASMSGVAGTVYSNSVLERLLQNHRTTGGPVGAFQAGMAPSPLSHDSGRVMNQHDIFSVQNRNRMIAALQQQQRQLTAASIATRGLPTLHQNISQDFRGAHRFMVDDFAGAGNLLSRSEQDMLLSRYPSMAVTGHMGLGGHSDMDFVNTTKLADLLLAKQVALQEAGKPRTTRLPCQARGMKADHNSSTAFFEVPEDARHGQHLLCSHPACRASGIKFRYCLHCKKPVTKQNFRSRHLHSEMEPNSHDDAIESRGGDLTTSSSDRKRSSPSLTDVGDPSSMSCLPVSGPEPEDDREERHKVMKMTSPAEAVGSAPGNELNPDSAALGVVGRRRRWANLLKERPAGLDTMDEWVRNVISVSDPRDPMAGADALVVEPTTSKPAIQESRWADLFEQRPTAKDGDAAVTNWLILVLQTSCKEQQQLEEAMGSSKTDSKDIS